MIESSLYDIDLCIVVPCYNEENRIPILKFQEFLSQDKTTLICFVNDGSSDNTIDKLNLLKYENEKQVLVVTYEDNAGKAEAVRRGVNYCNRNLKFQKIAYLDADLATSLEECKSISSKISSQIALVFGSRILKIGSQIERKRFRFLIGRIIATLISKILKLKVYDTQCGCKIFSKELSEKVFFEPFISKWLFDVEIFQRIILLYGRKKTEQKILEIPLEKWIDQGKSKVKLGYFFRMWVDLYKINRIYKRMMASTSINTFDN